MITQEELAERILTGDFGKLTHADRYVVEEDRFSDYGIFRGPEYEDATNQNGSKDDELEHYGVLGMKWGVRRTPEELGHNKSGLSEEERPKFEKARSEWKSKKNEYDRLKSELDKTEDELDKVQEQMRNVSVEESDKLGLGEKAFDLDIKADEIADQMVGINYDIKKLVGENKELFDKGRFDYMRAKDIPFDRSNLSKDEKSTFRQVRKEYEKKEKEYEKLDNQWYKLDKEADKIRESMSDLDKNDQEYRSLKVKLNQLTRQMTDIDVRCVQLDSQLWKITEDNEGLFQKAKYPGGGKLDHSDVKPRSRARYLAASINQNGSKDDELEHYGVLGMKWGIRKDRYAKGQDHIPKSQRRYEGESDDDYQKRMARESAERVAKTQAKAALKSQKMAIKETKRQEKQVIKLQEKKAKDLKKEKVDAEKRQIKEREDSQKRLLKSQEKINKMNLKAQEKKDAEQRKAQAKKNEEDRKAQKAEKKAQAEAQKKEKSKQKTPSNFEKGKKAKNPSKMTDQEVYEAIARMKLDQEYKRLAKKEKGVLRSTMESTLLKVGANVAYTQLSKYGNMGAQALEDKVRLKIAKKKAEKAGIFDTSNASSKQKSDVAEKAAQGAQAVNQVLAQMAYYNAVMNAKERSNDANHSDNQNESFLYHYGVLGMHWGIRKDEDESDFIGPMPKWDVNNISLEDFISQRGGLYSGDSGIVGRFHHPSHYQGQQREDENTGITDLGMNVAFDHDAWNSAEERDRLGVIDYGLNGRYNVMNTLLRDGYDKAKEIADKIGYSVEDAERSIDGMTKILNNTHVTRDLLTDKRIPQSALSSLFGVDADILKDRSVVGELIGSKVMDEGFFSTSLTSGDYINNKYGDVQLHTYIPKGSQAIYMEEPMCLNPGFKGQDGYRNVYRKSWLRGLYEVCLNRGSTFKVAGITMDDNDNITDVYLDLIGQHGRDD